MKKLSRWSQIGNEFGIKEEELVALARQENLTDENGKLTKSALDTGILIFTKQGLTTITAENKHKALILGEFEILKTKSYGEREYCVLINIEGAKNLTTSKGEVNVVIHESVIF